MPDFVAMEERTAQYANNTDTLCKSTPRMKGWPVMPPNGGIKFFEPRLQYTPGGADVDLNRVVDKPQRRNVAEQGPSRPQKRNPKPNVLNISGDPNHSAKELCGSETSWGPDFVSVSEGIWCDMSAKEAWPLCSSTTEMGCFDTVANKLRGSQHGLRVRDQRSGRDMPHKEFDTVNHWE
ncbi:hypothetical protein EJ08DRAFT_649424 [Tothia fuscella]|uniref:Uncharacterized protein n=1 Tax=Tothia fuscella TaxID=1048955 RepID=A0A9P4TZ08_9PEZI|nr:hypothetical protein EJ08DRAFT_649424 [Tothia fuscella]